MLFYFVHFTVSYQMMTSMFCWILVSGHNWRTWNEPWELWAKHAGYLQEGKTLRLCWIVYVLFRTLTTLTISTTKTTLLEILHCEVQICLPCFSVSHEKVVSVSTYTLFGVPLTPQLHSRSGWSYGCKTRSRCILAPQLLIFRGAGGFRTGP